MAIFFVSNLISLFKYSQIGFVVVFVLIPWVMIGIEALNLLAPDVLELSFFSSYALRIVQGSIEGFKITNKEVLAIYSIITMVLFITSKILPAKISETFSLKEKLILFSGINALGWTYPYFLFFKNESARWPEDILKLSPNSWPFWYVLFVIVGVAIILYALVISIFCNKAIKFLEEKMFPV